MGVAKVQYGSRHLEVVRQRMTMESFVTREKYICRRPVPRDNSNKQERSL